MAARKGRKPLPKPKGSNAQIPIYGGQSWRFDGLHELPSPYNTGWPFGYVPEEIRQQMLMHPKVSQACNNLKAAILGDGGRVIPAAPPGDPRFDEAREIAKACHHALRHMRGSWHQAARMMLDAVDACHKVADKTLREEENGTYAGYWMLDTLNVWPNGIYRFMRDAAGNVPKLKVRVRSANGGSEEKLIDREKFAVLSFRPVNNSPYGTTVLNPAYEGFYKDVQLNELEMAWLAQFSRPSIVVIAPGVDANGSAPPDIPLWNIDGSAVIDENTGQQKTLPAAEAIALKLEEYEAGSIVVLPGGAQFKLAEAQQGADFGKSHEQCWRLITAAILGTDQATEAQRSQSNQNQGASESILSQVALDAKRAVEEMVENDIFRDIVRYNFGDAALDLLPIFDLGSTQNQRLIQLMNAVSGFVNNGAFDKTQWWHYCAQVGLPLPDPDADPVVTTPRSTGGAHGNTADGAHDSTTNNQP